MYLPNRPFTVSSSFVAKTWLRGLLLLLLGIGCAGVFCVLEFKAIRQLLHESEVWKNGVPADESNVSGEYTSNDAVLNDYKLNVEYMDASRHRHQSKLEFSTLFNRVNERNERVVRYLPSDPSQYALSIAIDAKGSRWMTIAFMFVVGTGLIGGAFSILGYQAICRVIDAKRCAARSEELHVPITKVIARHVRGKHKSNTFHFNLPLATGGTKKCTATFSVKEMPLTGDPENRTLIALRSDLSPKRAIVPRSDLYPFVFPAGVAEAIRAKVASTAVPARPAQTSRP